MLDIPRNKILGVCNNSTFQKRAVLFVKRVGDVLCRIYKQGVLNNFLQQKIYCVRLESKLWAVEDFSILL